LLYQLSFNLNEQTIPLDVPNNNLFDLYEKSIVYTPPLKSVIVYVYLNPPKRLFSPNTSGFYSSVGLSKNLTSFLPPVAAVANNFTPV